MAQLFKRPGCSNWYAWIKDPRGHLGVVRRSTKCRVKSHAEAVADAIQAATDRELGIAASGPAIYFSDAATSFIDGAPLKASSRHGYRSMKRVILASVLGDFHLADLSVETIKDFVTSRRAQFVDRGGKGATTKLVSDATIRRNVSFMSAVYDWAIDRELAGAPEINPFLLYKRKSLKESQKVDRNLRPDQFQLVLDACQTIEHRRIVIVLTGSGIRTGELLGLTWPEVRFEVHAMEFGNLDPNRTKTAKARLVPLLPAVERALHDQMNDQKKRGSWKPDGYVFPSPRRDGPRTNLSGLLRRIKRVTKMDLYTNHGLRATFASWALRAGADPIAVRDTLGHSTLAMTTRYAHHLSDTVAKQIRGMNFPFYDQNHDQTCRFGQDGHKRPRATGEKSS